MTTAKPPAEDKRAKLNDLCPFCDGLGKLKRHNNYEKGLIYRVYLECNVCGEKGWQWDRNAADVNRRSPRKRDSTNKVKTAATPVPPPPPPADGGGMKELPPAHASVIALHELPAATGLSLQTLGVMALAGRMPRPVVTEGAALFDRLEIERWNLDNHAPPYAGLPPRNDAERDRIEWMHRTFDERAREAVARLKAEAAGGQS